MRVVVGTGFTVYISKYNFIQLYCKVVLAYIYISYMHNCVFTDTLTMADFKVLTNELHSITNVWYQFGVELKVPVVTLKAIERQYKEPASCLTQLLTFWLSNTTPSPTWQTVVGALSCASIERKDLARHITETYCHSETGSKYH